MQLIDRGEARLLGLLRYFTGKPCVRGHVAERIVSTRACLGCVKQRSLDRRAADPEGERTKERARCRRRDPEHERKKRKRYYTTDKSRQAKAKSAGYAPPPLEKDCPPRPKDSKCQCCGKERCLVLDHDHHTGEFRGWICNPCNTALGAFGDSMAGVRRVVQYMAKFYLTGRSGNARYAALDNDAKAVLKARDHDRYVKRMAESPCS